jgi:hypothetical protein
MKYAMTTVLLAALGLGGCASPGNGGATGAAPERYMGLRPNVNGTWNGATSSSSMLSQRIKQDSARGATSGGASTQY